MALDYLSVFIFALTGALVASRSQLDVVGFVFVACLTLVGLFYFGQTLGVALLGCAISTFVLRAGSLAFGWRLPVYKSRPPRA